MLFLQLHVCNVDEDDLQQESKGYHSKPLISQELHWEGYDVHGEGPLLFGTGVYLGLFVGFLAPGCCLLAAAS